MESESMTNFDMSSPASLELVDFDLSYCLDGNTIDRAQSTLQRSFSSVNGIAFTSKDWARSFQDSGFSITNLEKHMSVRIEVGDLARLRARNPVAQQSANLIMQALRAFPEKMLHRDNFPFFIHPSWHLPDIPEPLAVCSRIAQMFVSRTPEIMPFIWRSIRAEQLRLAETV